MTGSAVDAVHPERPGGWATRELRELAGLLSAKRWDAVYVDAVLAAADLIDAALPSPPVAPQAAVDVTALPEPSLAHLVTLHQIAAEPNNAQYQRQWSGRLQGMAMAGLVWRFTDGPWRPSAYGRQVLTANYDHPKLVEIRAAGEADRG